jgi:hypothetical protein
MRKGFTKMPLFGLQGILEIPWGPGSVSQKKITGGAKMKKNCSIILLGLILSVGFSLPAVAGPLSIPGGPFITPTQEVSLSAILTFPEIVAELYKLQDLSKGEMTVETLGYSCNGRPLLGAVIGRGDTRMWLQGRIHGTEWYGAEACLSILRTLITSGDPMVKKILNEMKFLIIPCYNPDGTEGDQCPGRNTNRDWYPYYTRIESRNYWYAWESFQPHYAIDLHHQGTYYIDDTDEMVTLSIGIPVVIGLSPLKPVIWDQSRQMAVAGYDAVRDVGFIGVSRYIDINIGESGIGSMMLGNPGPLGEIPGFETAAFFFETRSVGEKSRGHLIKQKIIGVSAVIEAIATGELASVDPNRWDEIPRRGQNIPSRWADGDEGIY